MTSFHDDRDAQRFEQTFAEGAGGGDVIEAGGRVWADYSIQGDERAILHVEAEPALRGTGASGRFMQGLVEHARAEGIRLIPRCGYAVAWFERHPDQADVLSA